MDKTIKIVLGLVIFLGVLGGAFLLFSKKKTAPVPIPKTVQASAKVNSLAPLSAPKKGDVASQTTGLPKASVSTVKTAQPAATKMTVQDKKTLVRSQWNQCKAKTMPTITNLSWTVKITEGIPAKGTYAKGDLDSDSSFPVHVTVKADSTFADKIKAMLVVGKTAFLRGTCTEVATDGSVVLQAF